MRWTSAECITAAGTVDVAQFRSHFFQVPDDTPAFKVDFSTSGAGQLGFLRWHPYGLGVDSNSVSNGYIPGTVTAAAVPASGRVLLGQVRVITDVSAQLGSADVVVQSVAP